MNKIIQGDTLTELKKMEPESVNCIITSPPYWGLRDYGVKGQIGLEPTLEEYIEKLLQITKELKRVLRKDGVMFWNHGDCYNSHSTGQGNVGGIEGKRKNKQDNIICGKVKHNTYDKCMALQQYRLIIRMIDQQGWILRNVIIWNKPNHMPSSVKDRFANGYEPVFMLVKNKKYWFDLDAVRVIQRSIDRAGEVIKKTTNEKDRLQNMFNKTLTEKYGGVYTPNPSGKNPGDVWTIPTQPFPEAHFAVFPEKLVKPMIKAGCPKDGVVLDPFVGAGTTLKVARDLGRNGIGIEINPEYIDIAKRRIGILDKGVWDNGQFAKFIPNTKEIET